MFIELAISYSLKLLIIFLGLKLFNKNGTWFNSFLVFTIVHFFLIVIGNTMALNGIHNLWMLQLVAWWIMLMYALVYYQYLHSQFLKKIVLISTFLQIIGILLIYYYLEPITSFPSLIYTIINTGIVLNTLTAFLQIFQDEKEHFLERLPFFWINSSIFIVYFSTTLLFIVRNYIGFKLKNQELGMFVFSIISFIYDFADVIILIGILIMRKQFRNKAIQPITT